MCFLCEQFGEGDLWYNNPKLYSRRLYEKKIGEPPRQYGDHALMDEVLPTETSKVLLSALRASWNSPTEEFDKKVADMNEVFKLYGNQVLPLKDAKKVAEMCWPLAPMICACAKWHHGRDERSMDEYTCLGLGQGMYKWERWPERYRGGAYMASPDECKDWLERMDKMGLVHLIMQYGPGYMGGICNCDYPICGAFKWAYDYGISYALIKSHYVAKVDFDKCTGCGKCVMRCQSGCLTMDVRAKKPYLRMEECIGCGLCETGCPEGAISLPRRETFPALKDSWFVEPRHIGGGRKAPKIVIDTDKCTSPWDCKKCAQNCPMDVFYFGEPRPGVAFRENTSEEFRGRLWPIFSDRCVGCNDCVDICPVDALTVTWP